MDFIIALMIFIFTLVVYFSYTTNFQKQEKGDLGIIIKDMQSIASSLTLSGYPQNWDNATVIRIGIADEQRLNVTKLRYLKNLNYSISKKKLATPYDYFVFFVNENDTVLNIYGICGVGYPLINTSYNIRSAYYYQDSDDSFLKDFMTDTFKADVYFDDNPSNLNDIDSLISNLSKYRFLVLEHPLLTASKYSQYKDELENYSSTGSLLMISGELTTSQGSNLVGSDFYKKSGQSESDRNSTVNASDEYLSLIAGENIVFSQAYYVENTSTALNFFIIASFNLDNKNAIAKWQYGNGTVYSFSDFSVSYFNGNFVNVIEEAAKALVQGTCNPINITGIDVNNLVKTERYLIYNSKVVKMVVYVWQ